MSVFVVRGKSVAATVVIVASATASSQSCSNGDCTSDNCGRWGGSSQVAFQSCVQGLVDNGDGTSQSDLVLIDASGNEVFRCTSKHPPDTTACDSDFASQRETYCATHPGGGNGGASSGTGSATTGSSSAGTGNATTSGSG